MQARILRKSRKGKGQSVHSKSGGNAPAVDMEIDSEISPVSDSDKQTATKSINSNGDSKADSSNTSSGFTPPIDSSQKAEFDFSRCLSICYQKGTPFETVIWMIGELPKSDEKHCELANMLFSSKIDAPKLRGGIDYCKPLDDKFPYDKIPYDHLMVYAAKAILLDLSAKGKNDKYEYGLNSVDTWLKNNPLTSQGHASVVPFSAFKPKPVRSVSSLAGTLNPTIKKGFR